MVNLHQYPTHKSNDHTAGTGLYIRWQQGPIGQKFNGATVEVVIRSAIMRLEDYQAGPTACDQNREAIGHLNAALGLLDQRTRDRHHRGVIGQEVP